LPLRLAALLALAASLGGCAIFVPQSQEIEKAWPPELPQATELTTVPFYPQLDYDCGPAALAMVLANDGVAVLPTDLVAKVYLPARQGSLQIEMLAAPRSYGVVSWKLRPRLEDLLREVNAGAPVIVLQNYGVWPIPVWHYAVVVGFDRREGKVVLRSGEKPRLEMPLAVLEYMWKKSDYWAFVAVSPDHVPVTASEQDWAAAVSAMERVADRSAARTAYRALLARWPESVSGRIGLANVAYADGDLPAALQLLRDAVLRQPDSTAALNNLAQVLSDLGQKQEALRVIDEAIRQGGPLLSSAQETRAQILARTDSGLP
jgi:tetratricopeptide (TPR) repeat protein